MLRRIVIVYDDEIVDGELESLIADVVSSYAEELDEGERGSLSMRDEAVQVSEADWSDDGARP